jgi:hypothetical protein
MNRKNLTAAVLAGLAGAAGIVGSAQAVNINPDGLGQVLIYPYYTTNGGNATILSVVNTSEDAKAVKVRFLEGQNSQEVLDFNLYLSAYDVWVAAIFNNDGTPSLIINDTTCTVPYLYLNDSDMDGDRDGIQAFLPFEMAKDGGSSDISRAAEGHFEMIEMGTLVDDNGVQDGQGSATAATHVASASGPAMPADCQQLVDAWTDPDNTKVGDEGYWLNSTNLDEGPETDLIAPSGGLFGGAAVIDVNNGAMYSYDAKAINGFASDVFINFTSLHQVPGNVLPSLNSGDGYVATVFLDSGATLDSTTFTRSVDAISFLFMHDQVMNEYTTEAVVGAGTEWVVTFPTKNFYVYEENSGSMDAIRPFTNTWDGAGACEVVSLDRIWDREEQTPGSVPGTPVPPIVSPAPPNPEIPGVVPFSLCFETSVIRFDGGMDLPKPTPLASEILGSTNFHTIDNGALGFESGWVRLQLADYPETNPATGEIVPGGNTYTRMLDSLTGLPIAGFSVVRFQNAFLGDGGDVLANYGGLYQHKGTRMQSNSSQVPTPDPVVAAP